MDALKKYWSIDQAPWHFKHSKGLYFINQDGLLGFSLGNKLKSSFDFFWKRQLGYKVDIAKQKNKSEEVILVNRNKSLIINLSWGSGSESKKSRLHEITWLKDGTIFAVMPMSNKSVFVFENTDTGTRVTEFYDQDLSGLFPIKSTLFRIKNSSGAKFLSDNKFLLSGEFGIAEIEVSKQ